MYLTVIGSEAVHLNAINRCTVSAFSLFVLEIQGNLFVEMKSMSVLLLIVLGVSRRIKVT